MDHNMMQSMGDHVYISGLETGKNAENPLFFFFLSY